MGVARLDAAADDVDLAAERGLGVELQDTVARLFDATGRADDRLKVERSLQGADIRVSVDVDGPDLDRLHARAEVDASLDEGGRADVGRSHHDARRADGQLTGHAGGGGGVERPDGRGRRAAEIIEHQSRLRVFAEVGDAGAAVDRDHVGGGDRTGERLRDGGVVKDESLGGIERGRDQ